MVRRARLQGIRLTSPSSADLPARMPLSDDELPLLKKQITVFAPLRDAKLIRAEAARRKVSITSLVVGWLEPELAKLRHADGGPK